MNSTYRHIRRIATCLALCSAVGAALSLSAAARQSSKYSPPSAGPLPPAKVIPPSAATADTRDRFDFNGEDWHEDAQQVGTARRFIYRMKDTTLTGDAVRYDRKKQLLDAEGSLVLNDGEHHMTGRKAHVDYARSKRLAVITGDVVIQIKAKSDAAGAANGSGGASTSNKPPVKPAAAPTNAASDDTGNIAKERGRGGTLTCDRVDYYYAPERKFAIATGNVVFKQRITQKDGHVVERTFKVEHAEYDGKNERLVAFPPVDVTDSDREEMHFQDKVIIGTKEGAETLETKGSFKGLNLLGPDEDENSDTTAASAAQGKSALSAPPSGPKP